MKAILQYFAKPYILHCKTIPCTVGTISKNCCKLTTIYYYMAPVVSMHTLTQAWNEIPIFQAKPILPKLSSWTYLIERCCLAYCSWLSVPIVTHVSRKLIKNVANNSAHFFILDVLSCYKVVLPLCAIVY